MINIKLDNFSYRNKKILENAVMSFEEGTINALVGANGSGKSTMLSIITGEKKIKGFSFDFKGTIGYVPQENPLLQDSTGFDNLFLWYKGSKKEFQNALSEPLIKMLNLNDFLNIPVKKMSGGMKKRISIAIALINKPQMLILDEPSSALDLLCKEDIRNYLINYKKSGGTVLITSHDEDELSLCDNTFLIKEHTIKSIKGAISRKELIDEIKQ